MMEERKKFVMMERKRCEKKTPRFLLEVGCGSGAITIALLKKFPKLHAVAIDISPEAVELTKENAILHNVNDRLTVINVSVDDFIWDKNIILEYFDEDSFFHKNLIKDEKFDLIISNPPYIPSREIKDLQSEVKDYESHIALDGGVDGS